MDDARRPAPICETMASVDEWTDLDDAYLDIFGEHPDLGD